MARAEQDKSNVTHTCPCCGQDVAGVEDVRIDAEANVVVGNGIVALLTPAEMEVLLILRDAKDRAVSNGAICDRLYTIDADRAEEKIVDVWICKLRPKIAGTGLDIQTIWGKGYRLIWPAQESVRASA